MEGIMNEIEIAIEEIEIRVGDIVGKKDQEETEIPEMIEPTIDQRENAQGPTGALDARVGVEDHHIEIMKNRLESDQGDGLVLIPVDRGHRKHLASPLIDLVVTDGNLMKEI